ncbi:MAG TPA: AAA-like domain-containing protein [Verrucomicrobiae bacterium]
MSQPPIQPPRTEVRTGGDFYVTGGTLRPDAPSYIERQADKELSQCLLNGEFCYVLTSRQMGKSSLMIRTVQRLRQEGVSVAVLDLTAIGQNLTIEQWYDGLISRLGQQLKLEDELVEFWGSHPELGPLQRWTGALENVVLKELASEVVIFVDEIDIVRSLPFSTDEFFAAIRECYNRRAHEPAFNRLAFGLLGVATPTDLIRDTRMTPFNIGRRIELNDFTAAEGSPLAAGLGADEQTARELLARVLYWTGGHPYLTQRLCRELAESILATQALEAAPARQVPPVLPTIREVDRAAEKLFLSRQARDRDDNLIFVRERVLRSEVDVTGLLLLYRRIHLGELVPDDETNPLVSILHLSGIARGVNGFLQVRNRIYRHVFDLAWIQTNMPEAEVRRQKKAGRRGMVLGFGAAAVLLFSYLLLGPVWSRYHEANLAVTTARRLEEVYGRLGAYRDALETKVELGLGGNTAPMTSSGSMIFEAPDRVNFALRSSLTTPETQVQFLRDGPRMVLYAPALGQFQALPPDLERNLFGHLEQLPPPIEPFAILPVYRLFLDRKAAERFLDEAGNIQPRGYDEIEGQRVRILQWEHEAKPFLARLGVREGVADQARIPVTAWVNSSNNLVLQMRIDLSNWAQELAGAPPEWPITSLVITEIHRSIQTSGPRGGPSFLPPPPGVEPFRVPRAGNSAPHAGHSGFAAPRDAQRVEQLPLPPADLAKLLSPQREFARLIPGRLPFTPANLIDLSEYYNAAFGQTWHPGVENNNLATLPTGVLQMGDTAFDVRGIVQLSGKKLRDAGGRYPQQISGMKIGQACRQLHFLHGTGYRARDGAQAGAYILHYANGHEEAIPLIYGEDLRDWYEGGDGSSTSPRAKIVWRGLNDARYSVRLFKSTWVNPLPGTEIVSLDYVSAMSDAAPFLLAITAEP